MAITRPPVHIRPELDLGYRIENQSIEIFEIRPQWQNRSETMELPVAKTTYVKTQNCWKVYWQQLLESVDMKFSSHLAEFQNIYLLEIQKSDSLAFGDRGPNVMKNGKPTIILERRLLEKLGLGVNSSLINMISEQITKQSEKIDYLSEELKEKKVNESNIWLAGQRLHRLAAFYVIK